MSASAGALTVVLPAVDVDVVAVWEESATAAVAADESEVEGGGETAATGPAAAVVHEGDAAATGVAAAAEALQPELVPHASPRHLSKPLLAP